MRIVVTGVTGKAGRWVVERLREDGHDVLNGDARDVALACELSLTADVSGAEVAIIAAADTCMERDSASLMAEVYPTVPMVRELQGRETLLSIDRAREILEYEPRHAWDQS